MVGNCPISIVCEAGDWPDSTSLKISVLATAFMVNYVSMLVITGPLSGTIWFCHKVWGDEADSSEQCIKENS